MTSEWDGTPWGGSVVDLRGKAETGPFVSHVQTGLYLSGKLTPQRMMRRAQAAYHSNPWIGAAESTVTRRLAGLPWHLEDGEDEEYEEPFPGPVQAAFTLLERPMAALPQDLRDPALLSWRSLISITSRHVGLCGMAYWYLDQPDTNGIPLALLYVNPARVWAATTDAGRITGWVVDPKDEQGHGGTPYRLDELLPFYLDPPDSGYYGTGLYERALLKAQITSAADTHALFTLGTGGRIPGILGPKEGTIPDEQYKTLVSEFRNVNEAPDAAKRTTIVRGPIEFTKTAADLSELGLVPLGASNRDDIFATWGVPPSTAGIPTSSGGLNSGETRKYDEAVLMQGVVHDRVRSIVEPIQFGLLDRWKALGVTIDLEVEEPEFDDKAPMFVNAEKAASQPLKNSERRELLGYPPFGDPRDEEVWLPATYVLAYGSDGQAPPEPVPPPSPFGPPVAKANRREFLGLRKSVDTRWVPRARKSVGELLAKQRADAAAKVRATTPDQLARHRKDPERWFTFAKEAARLSAVLRPLAAGIASTVADRTTELLRPRQAKADPFTDQVVALVTGKVGDRVTGITRTTQDAIAAAVLEGYEEGLSPAEIADRIEGLPAFDAARAELVGRTETMLAYNDAALTSYSEYGVTEVLAYDGDEDQECAARDGQTFTVEEAEGITDHPNGTLDWAPVLEPVAKADVGKAIADAIRAMPAPINNFYPPIVHVQPAAIHVEPAAVNVQPPDIHVAAPIVNIPQRAPMRKTVERDATGQIIGVTEHGD